ncbi:MAG: site-specific DNA inversion stimulation factor [Oligoflexia bacterium]|nr:site-specific DNA inversion stimulation factor [Oligoflexia bacterium]
MASSNNSSSHLFVANLNNVSLEKLVRSKLEIWLKQIEDGGRVKNFYDQVLEQVEKPMIELALISQDGNQIKAASLLGINRNTLRKKMKIYKIKPLGQKP